MRTVLTTGSQEYVFGVQGLSCRLLVLGLALASQACSGGSSGGGSKTVASFAQANVSLSEGDAGAADVIFTVMLDKQAKKTKRIDYTTVDGTALASEDYTAASGTLIIPKGAMQGDIAVSVLGDPDPEADESFGLVLTSSKSQVTASATIVNDDAPPAPALAVAAGGIKLLSFTWAQVVTATHYRLVSDPDGLSGFTQVGPDILAASTRDDPVPVHLTDWANARFALEACNPADCASSSSIPIDAEMLAVIGFGKASNPDAGDGLGYSVAVSGDGSTMALSAIAEGSAATGIDGDQQDNSAPGSGAVYVLARSGATWVQEAYLKASNTEQDDRFGTSLALSFDGATLAVGATGEDSSATGSGGDPFDNSAPQSGAVYVFTRSAGAWTQEAYLKALNAEADDGFGAALGLSNDGDILAVGAPGEDSKALGVNNDPFDNSHSGAGAAYLLTRLDGVWTQEAYVKASNAEINDSFGAALALSGDGTTLAVGATGEDSGSAGLGGDPFDNTNRDSGAVFVFTGSGSSWTQELYAKASNAEGGDAFGSSLALSWDGAAMVVGAVDEDGSDVGLTAAEHENDFADSGAAYLFSRAAGSWIQELYIKPTNTGTGDGFGGALAISASGDIIAVGAAREDSAALGIGGAENSNTAPSSGAVYVFERFSSSWAQASYVKATNTEAGDKFGSALALTFDGATLVIGAPGEDSGTPGLGGDPADNSAADSGVIYLF